ncbi:hypothetical protein BX616_001842, partial [Lobosporangium transversale]
MHMPSSSTKDSRQYKKGDMSAVVGNKTPIQNNKHSKSSTLTQNCFLLSIMRISLIVPAILATTVIAGPVQTRAGCTATSYEQIAGTKGCSAIVIQGPFTVPANKKIDLTGLKTGTTIKITGTITFAKGNLGKDHDLVTIGGSNINIDGTKGVFDGNGPAYWDGKGGNGGVNKPKFVRLRKMSGSITGLTILRSPVHTFSVNNCNGLILKDITIDN